MSDGDLEDKLRGLTADVLLERQAAELLRMCWTIHSLDEAGTVSRAAAARAA